MVRHISHRIGVMCRGRLVELAPARTLCARPQHPYTKALLSAVYVPDPAIAKTQRRTSFDADAFFQAHPSLTWRKAGPEHFVLLP